MNVFSIDKHVLAAVLLANCFIGCAEQKEAKPIVLNDFDYLFTMQNKTDADITNSKIFFTQKGIEIDSGKFVISSSQPLMASIKFYDGKKTIHKEDTIKINIGVSQYFITEIEDKPVKRKKGFSPFSSSNQPTIFTFKIDGKLYNESETLIIK
ncbi:hypothetical protein NZ698_00020 [Chryseobacterium sp. PBS4-4]|uniref:Lipoprotein n=1 Tax=Chryseobacterium edaphi TaxID=2976532 RepID=A0ABT2VZY0_9FLAO|nr:hypothetical protein [Chryseobacterium edaphi]MCU7615566.1 hypothetical protein [Chryseobacterium edaphi]